MKVKIIIPIIVSALFIGCASVPKADPQLSEQVKELSPPKDGYSSIYVFRTNSVKGASLKKDVWIDGECLGETSRGVFFHKEVEGNKKHVISTESEFSPNHLELETEEGKQYFIQQFIKMGAFVGGANLKQVDEEFGKKAIAEYSLAQGKDCSKKTIDLSKK
jgi:hypothetical protein